MEKIALIDLDGTIANLDKALSTSLDAMQRPGEADWRGISRDEPWLEARRHAVMQHSEFWENLEPINEGMIVLDMLRTIGFKCKILSKGPSKSPDAWTGKFRWCTKHVPGIPVILTQDKSGEYGRVLFDDYPHYYESWLDHRPRGLVIALATDYNEHIPNKYVGRVHRHFNDPSILCREETKAVLQTAYNR